MRYFLFTGVRFFRARYGKTAHQKIGNYLAAAGKNACRDAEWRNCSSADIDSDALLCGIIRPATDACRPHDLLCSVGLIVDIAEKSEEFMSSQASVCAHICAWVHLRVAA